MKGKNNPRKTRAIKEVLARMTEDGSFWQENNSWNPEPEIHITVTISKN